MKTAVMTDSNSGITPEEGKKIGIYSLPMPVIDRWEIVFLRRKEHYTGRILWRNDFRKECYNITAITRGCNGYVGWHFEGRL